MKDGRLVSGMVGRGRSPNFGFGQTVMIDEAILGVKVDVEALVEEAVEPRSVLPPDDEVLSSSLPTQIGRAHV